MQEARWYEKATDKKVVCQLCPHGCRISEGERGVCRVRVNVDGKLYSKNYGLCTPLTVDPIEKKPLYHFYPGKNILSVGTYGCNFKCAYCQNWYLAHAEPALVPLKPVQIVEAAKRLQEQDNIGIAYTYSEPTVWYEFVYDTAKLAKEADLLNVLVTNGYIEEKPLKELLPLIDAWNIDLKAFQEDFYRQYIRGDYKPVLRTIETVLKAGCHVELTTLLVTEKNDSAEEIEALSQWCVTQLGKDVPLHFSRYFPNYRLNLPPTPLTSMEKAYNIAKTKLNYVYLGNAPELGKSNTYCPRCNELLILRSGYYIKVRGVEHNKCAFCGQKLPIIGL